MLKEISLNILIGLVSGWVSSIIIILLKVYIDKIFIPWYQEKIYQDTKIEGYWSGIITYHDGDNEEFIFNIKRKSHFITGEMISKDDEKIYTIDGIFKNLILVINYKSILEHELDRGSFVFILTNNGYKLTGTGSYYWTPTHEIKSSVLTLTRQKMDNI